MSVRSGRRRRTSSAPQRGTVQHGEKLTPGQSADAASWVCSAWRNANGGNPRKEEAMLNLLKKLAAEEAAQDLAEYGIALAVIGIIAAAAAIVIAKDVGTLWSQAQNVISS